MISESPPSSRHIRAAIKAAVWSSLLVASKSSPSMKPNSWWWSIISIMSSRSEPSLDQEGSLWLLFAVLIGTWTTPLWCRFRDCHCLNRANIFLEVEDCFDEEMVQLLLECLQLSLVWGLFFLTTVLLLLVFLWFIFCLFYWSCRKKEMKLWLDFDSVANSREVPMIAPVSFGSLTPDFPHDERGNIRFSSPAITEHDGSTFVYVHCLLSRSRRTLLTISDNKNVVYWTLKMSRALLVSTFLFECVESRFWTDESSEL